ncbi:FabD lysophospholipase-like protein [Coniophora puteana RWD-64-598 SS2]|uniref:FabD lysophospholipase-like protein n=1 Tax=Coniophora puteana (strain RWD-64-598) TaxID=741705 RepID=A0A5M3MLS8_CONPW|nr:FabD lysophospholipase-like protein [Coniophora puteana RWD-64-598 SS2]EIW80063.1 FabD lysophospholipase-like protein [Coniophora puteana RWD-64-598 SS2]
MTENENKPLRLLSIDGGGIRGMSALLIIREMMRRIQDKEKLASTPAPHLYFDMIGGSGTGGLIALMLGRLRMPIDDAIAAYDNFAKRVYVDGRKLLGADTMQRGLLKPFAREMFKADALAAAVKDIVGMSPGGGTNVRMIDNEACKVFVCTSLAENMNAGKPMLLRTYPVARNASPNCMIWEAARATTAHPGHFKPITVADGAVRHELIDAGLGVNNPCHVLLREAASVYPGHSLAVVISIGTGHLPTIGLPAPSVSRSSLSSDLLGVLRGIAVDCEKVAEELQAHFVNYPELYFRFNVLHGMQDVSWDAWDRQNAVAAHTTHYLEMSDVDSRLDMCVQVLLRREGQVQVADVDRLPAPVAQGIMGMLKAVPLPSANFTGRNDILAQMHEYFKSIVQQHIFVLHGPGGAGKTQLALKFIYDWQHQSDTE